MKGRSESWLIRTKAVAGIHEAGDNFVTPDFLLVKPVLRSPVIQKHQLSPSEQLCVT